jgi:hypothetical protein
LLDMQQQKRNNTAKKKGEGKGLQKEREGKT